MIEIDSRKLAILIVFYAALYVYFKLSSIEHRIERWHREWQVQQHIIPAILSDTLDADAL